MQGNEGTDSCAHNNYIKNIYFFLIECNSKSNAVRKFDNLVNLPR